MDTCHRTYNLLRGVVVALAKQVLLDLCSVCSHVLGCAPCYHLYFHSLEMLLLRSLFAQVVQKLKQITVWHCISKLPALLNTIVGILLLESALKKPIPKTIKKTNKDPPPPSRFHLKMYALCLSCEWGLWRRSVSLGLCWSEHCCFASRSWVNTGI